jgi:transcriptional regulatory protein LevR
LAELGWKLAHTQFSDVLQHMQHLMQLVSESHVSQQLAAHRSVQKEKVMRMLVEAQLHERDEMQAAHEEAFMLLDQKYQDIRQRYIDLCSTLHGYEHFIPALRASTCSTALDVFD